MLIFLPGQLEQSCSFLNLKLYSGAVLFLVAFDGLLPGSHSVTVTLYERACNLWTHLQWSPFFFTVIKFNISASFWCEYKSCCVHADQCHTMKHISDVEIHHHDVSSHTHTHSPLFHYRGYYLCLKTAGDNQSIISHLIKRLKRPLIQLAAVVWLYYPRLTYRMCIEQ